MPVRVAWENQYAIAIRTGAISASDAATNGLWGTGDKGPGGSGNCGLLLDEKPSIDPGVEVVTTEKTTGLSQPKTGAAGMGIELAIVKKLPKVSLGSMGLTPEKLEIFAWSLLQKGCTESGAGPYAKTCIPYVLGMPDPEAYIDFGLAIGDPTAGAFGQILLGAITSQLSVKGNQGERMILSAELMGRTYRNDYNHSTSVATSFTAESTADKSFLDFSWTIAGTAAQLQSVELTVANNVVPLHYNSLVPTAYTLGRLAVTGSLSLAMSTATIGDYTQINNFVAGTDVLIVGTVSGSSIVFTTNARYTGATVDPAETELLLTLPFEGVYDGTNHAIKIDTSSANQLSIPA